jgi:hypothetical protein
MNENEFTADGKRYVACEGECVRCALAETPLCARSNGQDLPACNRNTRTDGRAIIWKLDNQPTPPPFTPPYYTATINGLADMYAIAKAHNIANPAVCHAIKYMLRAGKKPGESAGAAYEKAIAALGRAVEIENADVSSQ